ncbi:hypothetical protein PP175_09925 [Aneurinibacillus sp. Ricciae_BoGa-3]|uniref:hypothetical protein n=1 Tax=Aneurinibacillus sp. Ricciae_BoGa-3 TaxID=3022697 RepID=UPI002340F225|nr:hypothetical protein [Aneurinibacillus sp. Ricciae_BoGa-3]WCK56199.1 hypothetical protein PP175_09925 [Aneurinibacillus sp. Ricciae_BoGa-3]
MKKQPSRKKSRKLFWVIGGGAAALVLIMVSTAMIMKWKSNSQAQGLSANNAQSFPGTGNQSSSASGQTLDNRVTMTPIDKTKDQAQTDVAINNNSNASSSGSDQSNGGYGAASSQNYNGNAANASGASGQSAASSAAAGTAATAQAGQGLDANTVNQLRNYGIRQGDLQKIDQMVADGTDPKEIAKSLRDNGNQHLAAIMETVPRRPKKTVQKDSGVNQNTDNQSNSASQNGAASGQGNNGNNGYNGYNGYTGNQKNQ